MVNLKRWENRAGMLMLVGALLAPVGARAQSAVRLGVQGGLNFVSLGGADAEGLDPSTGWHLGAVAQVGRGGVALMPGLLLTRKGALQVFQSGSSRLALSYLQVPLLAKVRLSDAGASGSIGSHFYLGPAYGIKVGCKVAEAAGGNSASTSCDGGSGNDPGSSLFKSSELSAILGFGLETGPIMFALQYELGLSSIQEDQDVKNRVISVVGRYFFGGPRPDRTMRPRPQ